MNTTTAPFIERLVQAWAGQDEELKAVWHLDQIEGRNDDAQHLLIQVTGSAIPSPDKVYVFGFAPGPDFPYVLAIAEVTPEEWERITDGDLALPEGWDLASRDCVWPRASNGR